MRQAKALNDLRFAFDYRLLRLELLAKTAAQLEDVEKRREAGYLAVELHNCWSGFARSFFLSVMCGTLTLNGRRAFPTLTGPFASADDALKRASSALGRTDEPHWFDQVTYTRLATHFGFNNLNSITAAFAYPTTFFKLATVRNFFAHKNQGTAKKVSNLGHALYALTVTCPESLLLDSLSATSAPLAIEWLHDAKVMSGLMLA